MNLLCYPLILTRRFISILFAQHSCVPNVAVRYALKPSVGLVAQVYSLKPINPEDELVQSYIDCSLGMMYYR